MAIQFPPQPVVPFIPNLCEEKFNLESPLYLIEKGIASAQLEMSLSNIEYLQDVRDAEEEYYTDLQAINSSLQDLKEESTTKFEELEAKKLLLKNRISLLRSLEQSLEDSRRSEDQKVALIEAKEGSITTLISEITKSRRAIDFYFNLIQTTLNEDDVSGLNAIVQQLNANRANLISRVIALISETTALINRVNPLPDIQSLLQSTNQEILDLEFQIAVDEESYLDIQEVFSITLEIGNTVLDQRIKLDTLDLDLFQQKEEFKISKLEAWLSMANKNYQLNSDAFDCAYSKAVDLGGQYKEQKEKIRELQRELFLAISQFLSNSYYTGSVVTNTFEGIELTEDENEANQRLVKLLPIKESKTGPTNEITNQLIFDGTRYGFEKTEIVKYIIIRTNPITTAKITISMNRYAYSSLTRVESEIFLGPPPQPNLISKEPQKIKVTSPFRTVQFDSQSEEDIQEELDEYQERIDELTDNLLDIQGERAFESAQNELELENAIKNLTIRKDNLQQDLDKRRVILAGENTSIPQTSLVLDDIRNEIAERKAQLKAIANRIKYTLERDVCAPIASVASGKNQPLSSTYPLAFTAEELKKCYGTDMTKQNFRLVTISFTIPYNPNIQVGKLITLPSFSPVNHMCIVLDVTHAFQVIRENKIIGQSQLVCGLYRIVGEDIPFPDRLERVLSRTMATRNNSFRRLTNG